MERPSPVRRSGAIWLPTRWLMASDLQGPRTWDKHRLRTVVPPHSDQPTIYVGDHAATGDAADLLRLHQYPVANLDHRRLLWGGDETRLSKCPCERRLHSSVRWQRSCWRSSRRTRPPAIPLAGQSGVPASWRPAIRPAAVPTDAGRRRVSFRSWLPARKVRGKQTKRHGLLPVCCPWPCPGCRTGLTRERLAWSWLTRPPVIRGFALCLPLTEREPLSLRGSRVASTMARV